MCQVIAILDSTGKVIGTAFQCSCHRLPNGELESAEDRWVRSECELQQQEIEAAMIREATKLHDPNLCDTRRVRKEFKEPFIKNLGRMANRVPQKARHW